ncbi:MAG: hypothetical protein IIW31_06315 [Clostridia bacterium]|nr:hypothetical protein [Clostridia bacterium]
MNGKLLLEALNGVDFDLVEDAEAVPRRRTSLWMRMGTVAAVCVLALAGSYLLFRQPPKPPIDVVLPPHTDTSDTSTDTTTDTLTDTTTDTNTEHTQTDTSSDSSSDPNDSYPLYPFDITVSVPEYTIPDGNRFPVYVKEDDDLSDGPDDPMGPEAPEDPEGPDDPIPPSTGVLEFPIQNSRPYGYGSYIHYQNQILGAPEGLSLIRYPVGDEIVLFQYGSSRVINDLNYEDVLGDRLIQDVYYSEDSARSKVLVLLRGTGMIVEFRDTAPDLTGTNLGKEAVIERAYEHLVSIYGKDFAETLEMTSASIKWYNGGWNSYEIDYLRMCGDLPTGEQITLHICNTGALISLTSKKLGLYQGVDLEALDRRVQTVRKTLDPYGETIWKLSLERHLDERIYLSFSVGITFYWIRLA